MTATEAQTARAGRPGSPVDVDVVVVGDANPDVVLRGDVVPRFGQVEQLLDAADLVLGGSAAIVASGLARLGVRTALVSVVGNDPLGEFVRSTLVGRGVDVRWLRTHPTLSTGLSVILSAPDDRAILTFPGTVAALSADDVDLDLVRSARHVHAASPFLQTQLVAGLPRLLAAARAAGASTSLDTNWDPAELWNGIDDVLAHTDLLLPNAAELVALSAATVASRPAESDAADEAADAVEQAGHRFAAAGLTVALKAGADGGVVWTPDGLRCAVSGPPVTVVDTTGAGDCFDAGYIAGIVDGLDPAQCLELAVVAGSLSTRAAGGIASQPDRTDVATARADGGPR